ncbi:ethanolamine ammonia-lyase subunit EutC [Salinisphaera aquimarina]|uniref:Ethanolamine ammonia-lyase small subunit n=1 Tax=Salinisphaera aquimarina TaxID=2094031 RepID=A0ABV7ENY3_9GAMM
MAEEPGTNDASAAVPDETQRGDRGGVVDNPWDQLRAFTDARIGLGRAGISLPTHQLLAFQLAHAQAIDAVHLPLDVAALCEQLQGLGSPAPEGAPITLHTQASDRTTYLQRPDLGRLLDEPSRERLTENNNGEPDRSFDLAIVIVDGLSSFAVQQHAAPFIETLANALDADDEYAWRLAPLTVVEQGRVAIGDEVGLLLNANAVLVLVGERPGLSSPDSLGLYLTWEPRKGVTDAFRNCISNIRPAGLDLAEASRRALYLLRESRQRQLSGVKLKDRTEDNVVENQKDTENFLIS